MKERKERHHPTGAKLSEALQKITPDILEAAEGPAYILMIVRTEDGIYSVCNSVVTDEIAMSMMSGLAKSFVAMKIKEKH